MGGAHGRAQMGHATLKSSIREGELYGTRFLALALISFLTLQLQVIREFVDKWIHNFAWRSNSQKGKYIEENLLVLLVIIHLK
ncbi:hypothetical protein Tco_0864320 [Tanacetum coccineum]